MNKRILITLLFAVLSVAAIAQNKKIAILQTVDKEDKVPYAVEMMVRSNLTKVISNTPGFEGYSRVDMSSIMDEQNFQRTGMVSEDQIKRLGEISGADFILVSEVAKVDAQNIYITASILNVETAKLEMSENVLTGTDAKQLQNGCEELAKKLLGGSTETVESGSYLSNIFKGKNKSKEEPKSQANPKQETAQPVVVETPKQETPKQEPQKEEKPKQEKPKKEKAKKVRPEDEKELISWRHYYYYLGDRRLSDDEYMEIIHNCPEAHLRYEKGKRQKVTGNVMLITGLTVAIAGGAYLGWTAYNRDSYYRYDYYYDDYVFDYDRFETNCITGIIVGGVGVLTTLIAIPIKIAGKSNKNHAYYNYNKYCAQPKTTLSFGATSNGVGVSLNF